MLRWGKNSVELSDALIHHIISLSSGIFRLAEWWTGWAVWQGPSSSFCIIYIQDRRKKTDLVIRLFKNSAWSKVNPSPKPCYFLHFSFDVSVLAQHKERRRTVFILTHYIDSLSADGKILNKIWLVIVSLAAVVWKKASVKLSDALIHITSSLLKLDV